MNDRSNQIAEVRSRICNVFLIVLAVTGAPALAASLFRITTVGWLPIMTVHIAVIAIICFVALFRNRLPYPFRATAVIAFFVAVGLGGLWQFGLQGAYYFAIVAPAVCAIFFGTRIGVAVVIASLLSAAAIGTLTVLEYRLPAFDPTYYATQPSSWLVMIIAWAMVAATLLASVVLYNDGLYNALRAATTHEAALRKSEELFRSLVENSPNAVSQRDLEGRYLLVNEQFATIMGVPREQVLGRTAEEVFGVAFGDSVRAVDREVAARGRAVKAEESFDRGDCTLWLLTTNFPIFGEEGEVTAIAAVSTDLTVYKQAEEEVTQLGQILDDSPVEVYSIDVESFRFIRVNRGARDNLGYSMDELRQLTPADIAPTFDPERLRQRLKLLREGEQDYVAFETVHKRKDGSTYPVRLRLQLVNYKGAQLLFGIAEDISERLRTEGQLRQAQKMEAVGQLTGGVAHDFNNLLSVILGNLEFVQDDLGPDFECRHNIEMAVKAAERGAHLTRRLLAFSRKQPLRPVPVDIEEMFDDLVDLLGRSLEETIDIRIAAEPGLWTTEIDPGQLENALLNLAINARDAMHVGGTLTIEATNTSLSEQEVAGEADVEPGEYILLSVSDTGEGMTPEMREHVFDPFFTTKEAGRGTGLGLSMVYGFVKQSGGHISIQSAVGRGTTVKLYLPRYRGPKVAAQPQGRSNAVACGNGEAILVVEDDADLRTMTVHMLESLSYGVLGSGTADNALEILESNPQVRLLLTDVVLPNGMSGHDLAARALEKNPDLPVLYMSGYTEDTIVHHGRLDEGVQLLEKPFRKSELAQAVRQALDGQSA